MSNKYRIYCTDEVDEGFKTVWVDTPPTTCPNDAGHSVNVNSISSIGVVEEALRISNINTKLSSSSFKRVIVFQYNPVVLGEMHSVRILASVSGGNTTSYTLELLNLTNQTTIVSKSITNLSEDVIIDIGTITTPPTEESVIELNVKRDNGSGKITFNEIVVYVDSTSKIV